MAIFVTNLDIMSKNEKNILNRKRVFLFDVELVSIAVMKEEITC